LQNFTASQASPADLQSIIYDLTSVVTEEENLSLKKKLFYFVFHNHIIGQTMCFSVLTLLTFQLSPTITRQYAATVQ
jgi:hypothetical protein